MSAKSDTTFSNSEVFEMFNVSRFKNVAITSLTNLFFSSLFFKIVLFYMTICSLIMSGTIHTGMEARRMDLEISGLVEQPWLQLMCCAICLLHGCNFRWWEEVQDRSKYWLVCCCWILEIEFNKSISLSIIRLANYSVTTSLIYKLIV